MSERMTEWLVGLPCHASVEDEPLHGAVRAFADDVDQVGVAHVIAADDHVLGHLLHAVLDAVPLLEPVVRHGHGAAGQDGIAADDAQFLQQHDVLAGLGRGQRGRVARASGTHYDDIHIGRQALGSLRHGLFAFLPFARFHARGVDGIGDSREKGHRRNRGARHHIHVERLVLHDEIGKHVDAGGAHAVGLARLQQVDAGDGIALGDDLDSKLAALAVGRAGPCLRALPRSACDRRRAFAFRGATCYRQRPAQSSNSSTGNEIST